MKPVINSNLEIASSSALLDALRAAGEPTRLRLLHLIGHEELSVMELVDILKQSQPRISRHLKLMTEAGLIERFPEGAFVFYRINYNSPLINFTRNIIDQIGDEYVADLSQLTRIRLQRHQSALAYFENIAPQWDEIRRYYVSEKDVEAAIIKLLDGRVPKHMIDLGTGSGRMLTLMAKDTTLAIGIDLSQQMLNIARIHVNEAGLKGVELRHGDIYDTRVQASRADLVVIHQVLHFLKSPEKAIIEAARLLCEGGYLLIVDFAPHDLSVMRDEYHHLRMGISDEDINLWLNEAGLCLRERMTLPQALDEQGLDVKIWYAQKS